MNTDDNMSDADALRCLSAKTENSDFMKSARQKWEALKLEIIGKIKIIDNETPWTEVEPKWWLEMNDIDTLLRKK